MEAVTNYNKAIASGALIALAGFILSGPAALAIVLLTKPQPQWTSAEVFAQRYHPVQNLPYFFGLLLISGMLMVVAGHYLSTVRENVKQRFAMILSLSWTIVFAVLVAFNYVCQTTFVHNMAIHYKPEYETAIAAFSMVNPTSFCWANEMWGYGFLGIATWLMSGYYARSRKAIQYLLVLNGIISIAGVAWTIIDISWVLTNTGLIAYFLWNILMIVLMVLIWMNARKLMRE